MKQKDIALIIVIVFISGVISWFVSKALFGSTIGNQKAEVVQKIDTTFPTPDTKYFNSHSNDPTQLIQLSPNNNNNPFNGTSQ